MQNRTVQDSNVSEHSRVSPTKHPTDNFRPYCQNNTVSNEGQNGINLPWDMEESHRSHSNRHATGANNPKFSSRPEVVSSVEQAAGGHVTSAPSNFRGVCEIPTPPPTPNKQTTSPSKKDFGGAQNGLGNDLSEFPLFQGLLNETKQTGPQVESTGARVSCSTPISIVTEQDGRRSSVSVHSPVKQSGSGGQGSAGPRKSNVILSIEIDGDMEETELERKKAYLARIVADAMTTENKKPPIALQDPPKSKLKRQLSIDTADRTDQAHKRQFTRVGTTDISGRVPASEATTNRVQHWEPYVDEVDGTPPIVDEMREAASFRPIQSGNQAVMESRAEGVVPPSPGFVNLSEICLTSPFTSLTPRKSAPSKESVFVFPESSSCESDLLKRRPQTARAMTSRLTDSSMSSYREHEQNPMTSSSASQSELQSGDNPKFEGRLNSSAVSSIDKHNSETILPPSAHASASIQSDVCETVTSRGFIWPENVSITQAAPFSPRIVGNGSPLKYPPTGPGVNGRSHTVLSSSIQQDAFQHRSAAPSGNATRQSSYETRLHSKFTHEMAPSQLSPQSKEINSIMRRGAIRSISDVERSPNEKELREMEEEARKKYERSISDPTYNPVRIRGQPQISGLVREERRDMHPIARARMEEAYYGGLRTNEGQGVYPSTADRRREVWQSDARRRLFSRDEFSSQDAGRHVSIEDKDPLSENMEIPREVSDFFHKYGVNPDTLYDLQGGQRQNLAPVGDTYSDFRRSSSLYEPPYLGDQQEFTRSAPYDRIRGQPFYPGRQGDGGRMGWSPGNERGYQGYCGERGYGVHTRVPCPPLSPLRDRGGSERSRPRYAGDMDVRLTCESLTEKTKHVREILKELDHDDRDCKCSLVEAQIFKMATDAYRKIHRGDSSQESYKQFQSEAYQTNCNIYKSLNILCGIKSLCKYGRSVEDIFSGSVVFRVNSPTLEAANDLWESYKSGQLEKDLNVAIVTQELKDQFNAEEICLKVSISWEEYKICKEELEKRKEQNLLAVRSKGDNCSSPKKERLGSVPVIHNRSRSAPTSGSIPASPSWVSKSPMSPFRDRKFSDSSLEQSPRRVFQEINICKELTSPTRKGFADNVFLADNISNSPVSSPKRKAFGFPWEHENLHPDDLDHGVPPSPRRRSAQGVTWLEPRESRKSDV